MQADKVTSSSILKCTACKAGANHLDSLLLSDKIKDTFIDVISDTCKVVTKIVLPGFTHCDDYINKEGPEFFEVMVNGYLGAEHICDEWLDFCSKPVITEIDLKSVVDDILKDKPSQIQDDNYVNNMY